jgi:hypothetical protein
MNFERIVISIGISLFTMAVYAAEPAPPKVALVIGNAAYPGKAQLANTVLDAQLMADTFRKLGYQTTLLTNADRTGMIKAIGQLADKMQGGGVAALYFAGHGLQLESQSYLLPVGLPPLNQKLVKNDAYPVQLAIDRLSNSHAQVSLIIVDACRNVPYGWGYRTLNEEGLAKSNPAKGMLIAYATAPGQLALDGTSGSSHSPFTTALAETMNKPGLKVDEVFSQVRSQVRKQTKDEQQPWIDTSLVGDFYFRPPANTPVWLASTQKTSAILGGGTRQLPQSSLNNAQSATTNLEWFELLKPDELTLQYNDMERTAHQLTKDDLPRLIHKAQAGNVIAQTTLGIAYRDGATTESKVHLWNGAQAMRITNPDPVSLNWRSNVKAVKWFRAAADQGFAIAKNELGEMYFLGRGIDKNVPKSVQLFEAAVQAGYVPAKLNLIQANAGDDPNQLAEQLSSLLKRK